MPAIEAGYPRDDLLAVAVRSPGATPSVCVDAPLAGCATQADNAIEALVQAHGLATVGDLMAALGIESMPRLLAMLGFSGDMPE